MKSKATIRAAAAALFMALVLMAAALPALAQSDPGAFGAGSSSGGSTSLTMAGNSISGGGSTSVTGGTTLATDTTSTNPSTSAQTANENTPATAPATAPTTPATIVSQGAPPVSGPPLNATTTVQGTTNPYLGQTLSDTGGPLSLRALLLLIAALSGCAALIALRITLRRGATERSQDENLFG